MAHFVPRGDKIFAVTSRYDDALADVLKKSGYKAGDTLKLILPFLKAYDVTDKEIRQFSARKLVLIANIKKTIRHIRSIAPSYIVSTSYEHYIRALCDAIEFPFKNTYCTKLKLDAYSITQDEKEQLKNLGHQIAQMPVLQIPPEAKSFKDLPENGRSTIERLDEIFWEIIDEMHIGRIYSEINPVGGNEKAEAIDEVANKLDVALADTMYVGDSITDEEAFKHVNKNGGLAVSFNGNQYAIKNAEIALISDDSMVIAIVAETFIKFGKDKTLNIVASWSPETLAESSVDKELIHNFLKLHPRKLPKAKIITEENIENLTEESTEFRKKVRGETVGKMG
jgi:energy-converting hydrogenase A subunit R